uniref:Sushi domain-containing protein n=1 Tax=Varanus komodoensis TaxID=61221 RepID=A0A8D2IX74_VARKO
GYLLIDCKLQMCINKTCSLPNIENGRIAPYYYSFQDYYFPMKRNAKLSYSCLAGYTTESGSQGARINCTTRGWAPAPRFVCTPPEIDKGDFLPNKSKYEFDETIRVVCHPGYMLEGRDNTFKCTKYGWLPYPKCICNLCLPFSIRPETVTCFPRWLSHPLLTDLWATRVVYKCK